MNRAQRRRAEKQKTGYPVHQTTIPPMPKVVPPKQEQPDFSSVPLATMCQSIQILIDELLRRGYPVYDFDNKQKYVQGIQIIQGKVYFLAAKEGPDHGKI